MTFEYMDSDTDLPPDLSSLYGLSSGFGLLPLYLIVGGAAAGAALMRFLASDEWSAGEYNDWMLKMDQTLHEWDKLGWSSGCWKKSPDKRRQWLAFWTRFSRHYGDHGRVTSGFVTDGEEKPARELLRELMAWGERLNNDCGIDIGAAVQPPPEVKPEPEWMPYLKWGAIGLAAVAALSIFTGVRNAFPSRRYY